VQTCALPIYGRPAEEDRVVADPRLHGQVTRFAARDLPRFIVQLRRRGDRCARPCRDDGPALHRLIVDGGRRQIETDPATLLARSGGDAPPVATHDQSLAILHLHTRKRCEILWIVQAAAVVEFADRTPPRPCSLWPRPGPGPTLPAPQAGDLPVREIGNRGSTFEARK